MTNAISSTSTADGEAELGHEIDHHVQLLFFAGLGLRLTVQAVEPKHRMKLDRVRSNTGLPVVEVEERSTRDLGPRA